MIFLRKLLLAKGVILNVMDLPEQWFQREIHELMPNICKVLVETVVEKCRGLEAFGDFQTSLSFHGLLLEIKVRTIVVIHF